MIEKSTNHGGGLCVCRDGLLWDPDLALPEGSQWGDIGKKEIFII
jgi:hypothetical protein